MERDNDLTINHKRVRRLPEIVNSDQGSQYTSHLWVDLLKNNMIKISMDGKGRATDNIWIERFWRTIKRGYIYLNSTSDGVELYRGIIKYIEYYNYVRGHSAHGGISPSTQYGIARPDYLERRNGTYNYGERKNKTFHKSSKQSLIDCNQIHSSNIFFHKLHN